MNVDLACMCKQSFVGCEDMCFLFLVDNKQHVKLMCTLYITLSPSIHFNVRSCHVVHSGVARGKSSGRCSGHGLILQVAPRDF